MARVRGITDPRVAAAITSDKRQRDREGRHPTFLTSHQVGSIQRVQLNHGHIQVKVVLVDNPLTEFPEGDVWLSIRQLDDALQARVQDHLRFTGAENVIDGQ